MLHLSHSWTQSSSTKSRQHTQAVKTRNPEFTSICDYFDLPCAKQNQTSEHWYTNSLRHKKSYTVFPTHLRAFFSNAATANHKIVVFVNHSYSTLGIPAPQFIPSMICIDVDMFIQYNVGSGILYFCTRPAMWNYCSRHLTAPFRG